MSASHDEAARGFSSERLDELRDRHARAQRERLPLRLEDLLAEVPAPHVREVFWELILDELTIRRAEGTRVTVADYLPRFPQFAEEIEAAFREIPFSSVPSAPSNPPPGDNCLNVHSRQGPTSDPPPTHIVRPAADQPPGPPANRTRRQSLDTPPPPSSIGGFPVLRRLGRGGFGDVYLARDPQLDRLVAIKVPNADALRRLKKNWTREARITAQLDHPHIVPVYHVGTAPGFPAFIVSKYIDGCTVADRLVQSPVSIAEAVDLVIVVAEALDHAHRTITGMVHRDIKPGNLLLDHQGRVHVCDFGLAIEATDREDEVGFGGTPPYMSPEQIRGEEHRIDGRSDIFSLGVVLYELLTGRRPFRAREPHELLHQITRQDPKLPRRLNPQIPHELERICLKALAKLVSERYSTARDLADDLKACRVTHLADAPSSPALPIPTPPVGGSPPTPLSAGGISTPVSSGTGSSTPPGPLSRSMPIVPKGLRAFDAGDAGFFLGMLPGPRDRDGLPESIRFWKRRIEQSDGQSPFPVGLLTGPSGCGKSSFVRAGLLPQLDQGMLSIYLEATADRTESQLVSLLQRQVPRLEQRSDLTSLLAAIRRGEAGLGQRRLLLVIDQFEQWLHAHEGAEQDLLASALRQCDGERLQALLLVRDDFSLGVLRFFRWLDIPLVQGWNNAVLDRFDLDHARRVLTAFGEAFGKLPPDAADPESPQRAFIERALTGLAENNLVVPVRLALFAEMFRNRPWTPEALIEVGGAEGVGRAFLDETFRSDNAPPQYRLHAAAAQRVLAALLPEVGSGIKGHRQSQLQLIAAAGYSRQPRDAAELLRILDTDLHLISPVTDEAGLDASPEPDTAESTRVVEDGRPIVAKSASAPDSAAGATSGSATAPVPQTQYHLTHDYLVPSLRSWLDATAGETPAGRARLLLREQSRLWNDRPRNRYLPTLGEYLQLLRWTPAKERTERERRMLSRAGLLHGTRLGLVALLLLLAVLAGLWFEARNRARGLIDQLATAQPGEWGQLLHRVDRLTARASAGQLVREGLRGVTRPTEAVPLRLAHLVLEPAQADLEALREVLLSGPLEQFAPVREQLRNHASGLVSALWSTLRDEPAGGPRRFRAAMALAGLDPGSVTTGPLPEQADPAQPGWTRADATLVVRQLLAANSDSQPVLREALRAIAPLLIPDLERIFVDEGESEVVRLSATNALADYHRDDPSALVRLMPLGTPEQFLILNERVGHDLPSGMRDTLSAIAATPPADDVPADERIAWGRRRANSAVTLLRRQEVSRALGILATTDDPEALTQFVFGCRPRKVTADDLLACLEQVATPQPGTSATRGRIALLLALGEYPLDEFPAARRPDLLRQIAGWHASDPSSGIHGAAGWLLRTWGQQSLIDEINRTPVPYTPGREWFTEVFEVPETNPGGAGTVSMTFVVFPPGVYTTGSRHDERDRASNESIQQATLTRPFAVLDREVTLDELFLFDPRYREETASFKAEPGDAAFGLPWHDAIRYCRWLGTWSHVAAADQAYAAPEDLDPEQFPHVSTEIAVPMNWPVRLDRPGYRLPTEAEWEVAARAGSRTAFGWTSDPSLLKHFGWFVENSVKKSNPPRTLRPNLRGVFDAHGNVWEWIQDGYSAERPAVATDPLGEPTGDRLLRGGSWINPHDACRSAFRNWRSPLSQTAFTGFRLARSLPR